MTMKEIGKEESLIQSRIDEFNAELDGIISKLYPDDISTDPGIVKLLKLSYEELTKISTDECSIGAYKLKQYAVYIQQKENRIKGIRIWLQNSLETVVGRYASNYGTQYTKYEEKRAGVIAENSYAKKLNELHTKYLAYESELSMLCNRITELSKTLSEIRQNKREKA